MTEITKNNCVYKTHPIFNLYAGSKDGRIIHIIKQKPHFGNKNNAGYMKFRVRKFGESGFKDYMAHKFVYECYHGVIPNGMQVDHKNDVRMDNRLCNLQLLSPSQNTKKSIKNRTTFKTRLNRKSVKGTNKETNEVSYYYSMYAVQQHLEIQSRAVMMVCDGITKSALSKKDNCRYTFEYVEKNLHVNYIKSKNIRPKRKTVDEKKQTRLDWWNKEFKCPKCGLITKNNSKYRHRKHCN